MSAAWVSARQARDIVAPGWNQNGGPTDVICKRAAVGLVRAKALLFSSTRQGTKIQERNHMIVKEFWEGELKQNWAQGDFSTWLHSGGWETHCEAFGVTFELSGIEDIASPMAIRKTSLSPAGAENCSTGGRPAKADWEAVMIEMARQLYSGDLQPTVQADIEKAIADHLCDEVALSESTIREHARPLWRAIMSEADK